jgi:hypothetical protein
MSIITDHAVLRYLERVHHVDVEGIRAHLNVRGIDTAAEFGCSTVILGDGGRLKLRGAVATTCLAPKRYVGRVR